MSEDTAEPTIEYRIIMPRISTRASLPDCKAYAIEIARRQGITGEPEVDSYEGRVQAFGGPMSGPQGYTFTWRVPA